MKTLRDIKHLEGVKALVRTDFNVPIRNGAVADDFRIRAVLPTIDFLASKGAKVVLVSHLESIDGGNPSLRPVATHLKKLGRQVTFLEDLRLAHGFIENELKGGECVLLENLRFYDGEKSNDKKFAEELASIADIFVNEAFSVCHRGHASIVGVPKLMPGYAGLQMEKEVANLSLALDPPHPFTFLLGGAKFDTKLPFLEKFMNIADTVFVGGALANDLFKEKGYEVGKSTLSNGSIDLSRLLVNPKLVIPADIVNGNKEIKPARGLGPDERIVDAGPETILVLKEIVSRARFILWNGPLGLYEEGFRGPTMELARMIAEATVGGATSIIGGGDTIAAIETLNLRDKFTFISTGGGAMLDFLAKGSLPGIDALNAAPE